MARVNHYTSSESSADPFEADEVFRLDGAAAYLQISLPTITDLIRRGDLRAARVGRQWRIRRSWINEYLDRATAAA